MLLLHVAGGVGRATLKNADNVVKTFAVSIAIALSCAGSFSLAAALSPQFFVGALVVLGATALYSAPDALLDAVRAAAVWRRRRDSLARPRGSAALR